MSRQKDSTYVMSTDLSERLTLVTRETRELLAGSPEGLDEFKTSE